jgi:hypothetical protein
MCATADHPIDDHYVITSRRGEFPDRWSWEIRRKSKPLGIKMTGDGDQPDTAAQICAGGISGRLIERRKTPRMWEESSRPSPLRIRHDLPPNFHPAAGRVSGFVR